MSIPAFPWTVAHQVPLPKEFSMWEYWSRLLFLQYSCLESYWRTTMCKILESRYTISVNRYLMNSEKAMAPHSSTLAWKILWTEEPGRLQSIRSLRVGHDWATSLSLFIFMPWRRKWQPTPVFLPGESQGWGSLVGCRLWGPTELDTAEVT